MEKSEREKELEQQITQLSEKNEELNQYNSSLLQDPEVLRIVQARQSGKDIKVMTTEELEAQRQANQQQEEEEVDYNEMDNSQLVEHILKKSSTVLANVVESKMKPILDKVGGVEGFVQESKQQQLRSQIEAARKKYTDFDDYRKKLVELNNEHPTLGVEELYVLAKTREGKAPALKTDVEAESRRSSSERPVTSGGRPSEKKERKEPLPRGSSGFRQLLNESLEDKNFSHYND